MARKRLSGLRRFSQPHNPMPFEQGAQSYAGWRVNAYPAYAVSASRIIPCRLSRAHNHMPDGAWTLIRPTPFQPAA